MTTHQAIQIVVRAAEAQSNGHQNCLEILRACEMVREMNKPKPQVSGYGLSGAHLLQQNHAGLLEDMQRMDRDMER